MDNATPNPGTDEALRRGCKCPIVPNSLQAVSPEPRYIYSITCRLHAENVRRMEERMENE